MKKWMWILGGVVGGLILLAAIGSMIEDDVEDASENIPTPIVEPTYTPEQQMRVDITRQVKEHDDNYRNIVSHLGGMTQDGLDAAEVKEACGVISEYIEQMKAALAFVKEELEKDREEALNAGVARVNEDFLGIGHDLYDLQAGCEMIGFEQEVTPQDAG